MNKIVTFIFLLSFCLPLVGQNDLPAYLTQEERQLLDQGLFAFKVSEFSETDPPPFPVRTMAEWEEIQALVVTWTSFKPVLAEIIRNAKEECRVIVVTNNPQSAESQLLNTYAFDDLDNVEFLEAPYNTIWIRDYGPNTVYAGDVDSLMIVDWIYNRPRPLDDVIPNEVAEYLNLPIYSTTEAPYEMVHTGGNFQSDGMGTAFSSELVLEENEPGNPYGTAPLTEGEIDQMMSDFMGIDRYIKMETLPYDGIHHIDMHMRLLDEETILVGEYPEGVADGPQIEANIQYVQDNFMSSFGTPYKFVRVLMPPDDGAYPDTWWADYRTYTNSVFVNKTILVPTYEEQFDTTALKVYEENLPGYNVVGIDCNSIIPSLGALHCITRAVGVHDPLRIVHQPLEDVVDDYDPFQVA
ncbi:MAG: agmatine deiminase family protein, partial [Phaeodactylibacter sp.]|nr:agmatine deiminase family protein [Phaeodactylibacter sp.]